MDQQLQLQRSARSGEEFAVDLESTPGSGAIWYFVPFSDAAVLVREDRKPSDNIGGALIQTFVFRVDAPGTYLLHLELRRAWEEIVRRRVSVTATVND